MSCGFGDQLERWERDGAGAEMPAELSIHVSDCEACSERVDEAEELRDLLVDAPVHEISEDRLSEMRFALQAAARAERLSPPTAQPSEARPRWAWIAAAAAALLAVGLTASLLFGGDGQVAEVPAAVGPPSPSHAVIEAEAESELVRVQAAPDEIQRVYDGTVAFTVRPLAEGERFRVLAGDGTVEVRGTQFRVDVRSELLQSVEVGEGRVLVRLDDRLVADLRAGQRWTRPDPAEPTDPPTLVEPESESEADTPSPTRPAAARADGVTDGVTADGVTGASEGDEPPDGVPGSIDAEFRRAWDLLRSGEHLRAAALFDALAERPAVDANRRAEFLYWAARAHLARGDEAAATDRARRSVETSPEGWHASDAAALVERLAASQ